MVSSGPVPWYNRPAREYPVTRWLRQRYPFLVSPAALARQAAEPAPARRVFPATRWAREQPRRGSFPAGA